MGTDPFDATSAAQAAGAPPTGDMPADPARSLAILTCMDARILPHRLLGLEAGDVHVLRNAGGRVTPDVLRSVALSTRLMGVDQVVVVHHTRCGGGESDATLGSALRTAGLEGDIPELYGAPDRVAALRADLEALRSSPLLPGELRVAGYLYDLDTGHVTPLAELESTTVASD